MSSHTNETGVLAINIDDSTHKTIKESGNNLVVAEPMESGHKDPEKVFNLDMSVSGTLTITTNSGKYVCISVSQVFLSDTEQVLNYSVDSDDPEHMTIYAVYDGIVYWMQMDGTNSDDLIIVNNDTGKDPKKRKWKFRKSLGGIEL
ncbi:MAG: hypothetical protein JXQ87_11800 [Bacteroidia bacterium]